MLDTVLVTIDRTNTEIVLKIRKTMLELGMPPITNDELVNRVLLSEFRGEIMESLIKDIESQRNEKVSKGGLH